MNKAVEFPITGTLIPTDRYPNTPPITRGNHWGFRFLGVFVALAITFGGVILATYLFGNEYRDKMRNYQTADKSPTLYCDYQVQEYWDCHK